MRIHLCVQGVCIVDSTIRADSIIRIITPLKLPFILLSCHSAFLIYIISIKFLFLQTRSRQRSRVCHKLKKCNFFLIVIALHMYNLICLIYRAFLGLRLARNMMRNHSLIGYNNMYSFHKSNVNLENYNVT